MLIVTREGALGKVMGDRNVLHLDLMCNYMYFTVYNQIL